MQCFLLRFHSSCVDLTAIFFHFQFMYLLFCIHISPLWPSLYQLSFFSALFPDSLSPSSILCTLCLPSIPLSCFICFAFPSIPFFFLSIGLWRNILWEVVTYRIFLWKQNYIYSNRSQHIDLQYQIVDEFNLMQAKLMHL